MTMTLERENEIVRAWRVALEENDYFRSVPEHTMRQTVWEAVYQRCPCTEAELQQVMERLHAMMTDPVMQRLRREHQAWQKRKHLSVVE